MCSTPREKIEQITWGGGIARARNLQPLWIIWRYSNDKLDVTEIRALYTVNQIDTEKI